MLQNKHHRSKLESYQTAGQELLAMQEQTG
jgi:hypothetical protein